MTTNNTLYVITSEPGVGPALRVKGVKACVTAALMDSFTFEVHEPLRGRSAAVHRA